MSWTHRRYRVRPLRTRLIGSPNEAATVSSDDIARIRYAVIGDDAVLEGPFGPRRLVYADYTASGRGLSFIEDHIRQRVLPLYANTHTEASATGLRGGLSVHPRGGPSARRPRLEAVAAVRVRSRQRALASPQRAARRPRSRTRPSRA